MMLRYRPYIVLAAGGLMALVTSVLVFNWLSRLDKPIKHEAPQVQATRVAVSIEGQPWGTVLTKEMLKLVPYPKESLPQGHFTSIERLKGRVLINSVTANEPVLAGKLAPLTVTSGGVAAVTNPEKRAMAVKVDDVVGVAGFINPGNRVDVLVAFRHNPPMTKIVLQNVLVLATGAEIEKSGKAQQPHPVKVITLEVTPQEAEKLALASTHGRIRLALRNHLGSQPVLTKGETIASLLASYSLKDEKEEAINLKKPYHAKMELVRGAQIVRYEIIDGQLKKTRVGTASIDTKKQVPHPPIPSRQNGQTAAAQSAVQQVEKPSQDELALSDVFPFKPLQSPGRAPLIEAVSWQAAAPPQPTTLHIWLQGLPQRYGPTQKNDTLYSIVTELDVPRDIIWQAIVHLWKTNAQHFASGRPYGLHTGAYLILSRQVAKEVAMMSDSEALQLVSTRESRRRIASHLE